MLDLTRQQREVLLRTLQGKTAKEIAVQRGCSQRSVEATLRQIRKITGATNSAQIVIAALSHFRGGKEVAHLLIQYLLEPVEDRRWQRPGRPAHD